MKMLGADKIVKWCAGQLGYTEKATNAYLDEKTRNAGSNNYTKYARDYFPQYQGQPWCSMFVKAAFIECFGKTDADKLVCGSITSAYCPTDVNCFKSKNSWVTKDGSPKKGDVIFFKSSNGVACHTGIVVDVTGGRVYTIEGNTSGASGLEANGGMVARKNYALSSSYILGYGRPDWTIVDGKQFAPKKQLTRAEAVTFLWRLWGSPEPTIDNPFEDVKSSAWYANPAVWAYEKQIATGKGTGIFAPNDVCTRAQFITFMWKASGAVKESPKDFPFVDVPEHAYYYGAVVWAYNHKLASGTSSNTFAPNGKITRAEAITMLWAANGRSEVVATVKFSDITEGAYYKKAVDWAVSKGITSGV